ECRDTVLRLLRASPRKRGPSSWLWIPAFAGMNGGRSTVSPLGKFRPLAPARAVELAQDVLEAIERPVEIGARDDERRPQANDRLVRLLRQTAFRQQPLARLARAGDGGIDLGAHPQTAAANVLERRARDRAQAFEQMSAEHAALLHQPFVADYVQRLEPHRGGERIAAEGRAVRARREH